MSKPLLPQPVGRQREVLYLPAEGHTVVLGTAGSGKTTLAMLRAAYLANPALPHAGKTLLLSFNNTLLRYFESFADLAGANVDVRTYHHFARGYLHGRGRMSYNAICDPERRLALVEEAVALELASAPTDLVLRRPPAFLADEIRWLMQHGIATVAEYVDAERTDRQGARLAKRERPSVFRLYERYREVRLAAGRTYDWDDLAHTVLEELARDVRPRMYRHVVIDEGQDFSPMMLRSLAALIPANGTLTFFGDMAQQIYGNKMSWRSAGLRVPKGVWEFKENYRNTRQIALLAVGISQMPYFKGTTDLVIPNAPAADGALPALVGCNSASDELAFVAAKAKQLAVSGSVAVLLRTRDEDGDVRRALPRGAIRLHRDMTEWRPDPGIYYGTYAAAKGLEFDAVLLPRLAQDGLPDPEDVATYGAEHAEAAAGKLLYVAVTRAKGTLILSFTGSATSLLPTTNLYDRSRA